MSDILYISTIILNYVGAVYAVVYLWLNGFSRYRDAETRNPGLLKVTNTALTMTLIFTGVSCLLADAGSIQSAITRAGELYATVSVTHMAVILACGLVLLIVSTRRSGYKAEISAAVGKLFKIALKGALIAMVLSWLLT